MYRIEYQEDGEWQDDGSFCDLDVALGSVVRSRGKYPENTWRVVNEETGEVVDDTPRETQILRRALAFHGFETQSRQLGEELDEAIVELANPIIPIAKLGVAINHLHRGRVETIASELADVELMIAQMRLHFGDEAIDAAKAKKLDRIAAWLDKAGAK